MPSATVTLSTTTLARPCSSTDFNVQVASSTGITAGVRLYLDRELMSVVSLSSSDQLGTWIQVRRGVDATQSAQHAAGITVTLGDANQFYVTDPQGQPNAATQVSPHINVVNGNVWYAMGDDAGDDSRRWWQLQTTTYGTTSMGVRTFTVFPPESSAP